MIAATAIPLTRGRVHGRGGRGSPIAAHAAPNRGSAAGAGDMLISLANSQKDNGRAPNWSSLLPTHGDGAQRRRGSRALLARALLTALGLGSLGHRPLQGRSAAGV